MISSYYLLGSEATKLYSSRGIDGMLEELDTIGYAVFRFEEGFTPSSELVEAVIGWNEYTSITEEEYNKIITKESTNDH